ncbi:hypothetical protein [Metabacillus arenae]|uniref:Uncharacterized protein n=1 Tax=Metabacillus arenae TaxID=2771434 RepID=A0A926RUV0_9BACI|nr:hypothetical protein [Metabacillus arenae]MBD1378963.1 hypothetical protein [Metabacillus arenae]
MKNKLDWLKNRKVIFISGITLSTLGVTTYLLKDEENRTKTKQLLGKLKPAGSSNLSVEKSELQKAGTPDPMDTEDNKMVSEGSTFSVQYYNKVRNGN